MKKVLMMLVIFSLMLFSVTGQGDFKGFTTPKITKIREYPRGIASQAAFNGKMDDILYKTKVLQVQNYYGSSFYYNNIAEAVDLKDGKNLWRHNLDGMVVDVRRVENFYYILTPTSIYQIEADTGKIGWRFNIEDSTFHYSPKEKHLEIVKAHDFGSPDFYIPSFDICHKSKKLILYKTPFLLQLIDLSGQRVENEFSIEVKHEINDYNFVRFFEDGFLLKNSWMLFRYSADFKEKRFEFRLRNYVTEQPIFINMPTGSGKGIGIPGVHFSYLISENGQLMGRFDQDDSMFSMTVVKDMLLLEHLKGRLYCLNTQMEKIWEWRNPIKDIFMFVFLPLRWNRAFDCSPMVVNYKGKDLIILKSSGVLYVLDETGHLITKESLIKQPSVKRANEYFSVASRLSPVVIDGQIHIIVSIVSGEISRSGRDFCVTDYLVTTKMKE